jgi:hypothetical protein
MYPVQHSRLGSASPSGWPTGEANLAAPPLALSAAMGCIRLCGGHWRNGAGMDASQPPAYPRRSWWAMPGTVPPGIPPGR